MERDEKAIIIEAILDSIFHGKPGPPTENVEPSANASVDASCMEHEHMNDYAHIKEKLQPAGLAQSFFPTAASAIEKQSSGSTFRYEELIADEYRDIVQELRNRLSNLSAQLHETTVALVRANTRIQELEEENIVLRSGRGQ